MVLLDHDAFLAQLTNLFNKTKTSGTVYVTLKKYTGQNKPVPRNSTRDVVMDTGESRCLFRASNGKRHISTIVMPKDVNKFQQAYSSLLRANLDNLKKRDRKAAKKSKKTKATQ